MSNSDGKQVSVSAGMVIGPFVRWKEEGNDKERGGLPLLRYVLKWSLGPSEVEGTAGSPVPR